MLDMLGTKLKEARAKSGLTQTQVEKFSGISQVQLSYYETGKREISISVLEKLASLYGYDLNYFITSETLPGPDIQMAYKANELCDEDYHTIAWAKTFITNLHDMYQMKKV